MYILFRCVISVLSKIVGNGWIAVEMHLKCAKVGGTGFSCYTRKWLQLRFLINWKTTGVLSYIVWKVFQTSSACDIWRWYTAIRKSHEQKNITSPSIVFSSSHFRKSNLEPKISNYIQFEIDTVGKLCVPAWGIILVGLVMARARGFLMHRYFLNTKITLG